MSFCEARFPIGCATSSTGEGIVGNHAYSVLDVRWAMYRYDALNSIEWHQMDCFCIIFIFLIFILLFLITVFNLLFFREISDVLLGEQQGIKSFFNDDYLTPKTDYSPPKSGFKNPTSDLRTDHGSIRLLRIRNPWGKKEWQGVFAEKSEVWTKKLRAMLDKGEKTVLHLLFFV